MKRIILALALLCALPVHAQLWSSILDPSRAIDWTAAGVDGGIPTNRTQCGSTINAYNGSAATINNAISACGANQYVLLGAGTFNLTSGITFNGKNNVTLRGSGPDSTRLIFSGTVGCVYSTLICSVSSSSINPQPPSQTANWTAGYSKGTTTVTISSKTSLVVGQIMYLDQLNDTSDPFPDLYVCVHAPDAGGDCATEGDSGIDRVDRAQVQAVEVTSISGGACPCTIGIKPGLYMPNWRSGNSPGAWWMNGGATGIGEGIEDLSVENNGSQDGSNVSFGNSRDSWMKNVRSLKGERSHVLLYGALRITIRDSYFFGQQTSSATSYGVETNISSSFLVENNIFHHLTSAMTMGEAAEGSVWGYNFHIDSYYCGGGCPSDWMQASAYHHTAGIAFTLFEGNEGTGFTADAIHGTSQLMTAFRNRFQGYDPRGGSSSGKLQQTIPVHIYARNRHFNVIGNVIGDDRRPHNNYEDYVTSGTLPNSAAHVDQSIYIIGWAGNQGYCSNCGGTGNVSNDVQTRNTLMRWGNYDSVTDTTRWVSSEVPTGLAMYSNAVPGSQTLPNSFYLSGKPSWYGSAAWPSIGPDVTGGDTSHGEGGHVKAIPARTCFYSVMGGVGDEVSALTFNANNCYAASSVPSAPTGFRIVGDAR